MDGLRRVECKKSSTLYFVCLCKRALLFCKSVSSLASVSFGSVNVASLQFSQHRNTGRPSIITLQGTTDSRSSSKNVMGMLASKNNVALV